MSNQQQPQRYKNAEDYNTKRGDERKNRDEWRRSRSRSGSRNHMRRSHHHRRDDSRSRSRSRSLERRRRRRHSSYSRSRSRSRGYGGNRHDRRKNSRRYRDSRSPSRTRHSRSGSRSRNGPQAGHNRQNASNQNTQYYDKYQQSNAPRDGGMHEDSNESSNSLSMPDGSSGTNVENLQLPKRESVGAYYDLNTDEPIDKERIHREIEEKLREALAKEGKVYPPPKPEASHPVFANDGSFLEIFKKMQEQQKQTLQTSSKSIMASVPSAATAGGPSTSTAAAYVAASAAGKAAPPPPMVGRRRGGKILKTGLVAKQKAQSDTSADPKDFWSLYLAEVNKYKSHACESDGGTRPLVK